MMNERFSLRAAVHLLLIKNGKLLLLRRFNTGWEDGKYSLIAGHVDGNETITLAMVREAKEEAGITIDPKDLHAVHVMHRKSDKEYIDFYFIADSWDGDPHIVEPDKADDMLWVDLNDIPENILPHIQNVIANYQQKIFFSEFNWI
ncbi:MAG: NUDIX domain-containing protein [Candidatus Woesebacteria bacterium]